MSMLANITRGRIKKPLLAVIYGPDGVGKTTFGCDAPDAVILGKEDGASNMDVARLPEPKSYLDIIETIRELTTDKHDFRSLVIDSLDWIEPLVWTAVCSLDQTSTIDKAQGGYGKGYVVANQYWSRMMEALSRLRNERKMNIILIAHSQIKAFNDPSIATPYDRYQLKLNEKAAALWREFVDFVGFATYEVFVKKNEVADKKAKAFGDGKRVLYTERRPSFDAKNRLGLPFELPLSFSEFMKAVDLGEPEPLEELKKDLFELCPLIKDEGIKTTVMDSIEKAGTDTQQLTKIRNRLRVITAV